MKKLTSLLFTFSLLLFTSLVARAATIEITAENIAQHRVLQGGNTYRIRYEARSEKRTISFTASKTESAMQLASGTAYLLIPYGMTVELTGGDADGMTGAGAGIEVASGATLCIYGGGTLYANGGAAANGANGGSGGAASAKDADDTKNLVSGAGGNGGNGGGGAGAGIGGRGGNGGRGGSGGAARQSEWSDDLDEEDGYGFGKSGSKGSKGGNGSECGTVRIASGMTVVAKGGSKGADGEGGWTTWPPVAWVDGGFYNYATFGGGGGGGGAGGGAAYDIGGGGAGGTGGGGGGSGAIRYKRDFDELRKINGWGQGGKSPVTGEASQGHRATGANVNGVMWNGDGGDPTYGTGGDGGGFETPAASPGGTKSAETINSPGTVNWNGAPCDDLLVEDHGRGDEWDLPVWFYDLQSNTLTLRYNGQYVPTGNFTLDYTTAALRPVTLTGLPPNTKLSVSGMNFVSQLETDSSGKVTGLYLSDGDYDVTVGEGHFVFTVSGGATSAVAGYSVDFHFGEHIGSVEYAVNGSTATKTGPFTLPDIPSGTKVTYAVTCDEGYGYFGATELTVGTADVAVDLTAVQTGDFTDVAYCGEGGVAGTPPVTAKRIYPQMDREIGGGNWYAIEGNVTVGTLTVNGTANLILVDGTTLTVEGGIRVTEGNALNIYAQSAGTGKLVANGADGSAGIGGGRGENGTQAVDATAGGSGGAVTIYGGHVVATGNGGGAGIGGGAGGTGHEMNESSHIKRRGGHGGQGGVVVVCNGVVEATGNGGGAGIGGGAGGIGKGDAANQGRPSEGGEGGAGGSVAIYSGRVSLCGGQSGVGIGGGAGGAGGATRFMNAADGGAGGAGGSVAIYGGVTESSGIVGIGGGKGGAGGVADDHAEEHPLDDGKPGEQGVGVTLTVSGGITEAQNGIFTESQDIGENMMVTGKFNELAYIKIAEKPGPTCEGGEIAEEGGVWVVTPNTDAKAVTIENLPTGAAVAIKLNGYTIPSAAFMGFGTGENANVFSLALNPEGEVNGVKVTPTIGELSEDEGEPFTVGEGSAAVTVKAIPGLKYTLKRTDSLRRAEDVAPYQEVAVETATGPTVTLTDDDPPADKAFYTIGVSVP